MDNSKLNKNMKDAIIIIFIFICFSFIFFRIGVWKGENNIAIQYDIKINESTYLDSSGSEWRIPFRLFD
ncbi:MAG: hypothetical protein ACYDEX_24445 [Mobilitalea sp.]